MMNTMKQLADEVLAFDAEKYAQDNCLVDLLLSNVSYSDIKCFPIKDVIDAALKAKNKLLTRGKTRHIYDMERAIRNAPSFRVRRMW